MFLAAVTDTAYPLSSTKNIATAAAAPPVVSHTTVMSNSSPDVQIPIEPKDDIDPDATKPSPITWTARSKFTTNSITSIKPRMTTTTERIIHAETPFSAKVSIQVTDKSTDKSTNPQQNWSESHVLVEHVQQLDPVVTLGISEIISIIVVLIVGVMIAAIVVIIVLRRRKSYKRTSGKGSSSILSEDSDVRFLTSDEVLDFNLARPNEYDEL